MRMYSHYVGELAKDLLDRLIELETKIKTYSQEEVRNRLGSNICFYLNKNELTWLSKINKFLLENENISLDTDIASLINDKTQTYIEEFNKFNDLLDEIYKSEQGSINQKFFYMPFFNFVREFIFLIKEIYQSFIDKFNINKILISKEQAEKLLKQAEVTSNNSMSLYENLEKKGGELLLKLEQKTADKDVADIKEYYSALIKKTKCERNLYGILYGASILIFIITLIYLFINSGKLFGDNILNTRTVISATFIGFFTFIINDFRKRFNINKQILDELDQKQIIVDTYSSLLSKIDKFNDETKEAYHQEILQNIVGSLLSIKNHGFLGKYVNSEIPNLITELADKIANAVKN